MPDRAATLKGVDAAHGDHYIVVGRYEKQTMGSVYSEIHLECIDRNHHLKYLPVHAVKIMGVIQEEGEWDTWLDA